MFDELCNSTIYIAKKSGQKAGPFPAILESNKASIFRGDLNVDEGDTLTRALPNGKVETYKILQVHFEPRFEDIPDNYSLKLRKEASLVPHAGQRTTNIHIANSQGFQVGDHNVQNVANAFHELRQRIEASEATAKEKREAKSRLAKLAEHPVVVSILGGVAGGLAGLAGDS